MVIPLTPLQIPAAPDRPVPLSVLPPLSLYVHIPWCIRKCPYCDFNSHAVIGELDEDAYVAALMADLESELPFFWGRTVHTVFIGGGTPGLFSPQAIGTLIEGINARVRLLPGAEITMETNPGTFERERFAGFAAAGVNRLSVGVQSFDNRQLALLGRVHDAGEAFAAVEAAQALFERVNTDIMYGLPEQTPEDAAADIHAAVSSGVSHISAYQLTMEPNTPFGHTPPAGLPDTDAEADIEDAAWETLQNAGFSRYEVSAFARPGMQCAHNTNYWQFGDYIGIGAGAHGKISSAAGVERTVRARSPKDYLNAVQNPQSAVVRRCVSAADLPFEFMMNVLRLTDGVPASYFPERTGLDPSVIGRVAVEAVGRELLDADPLYWRPSTHGLRFLNDLLALFLPDRT